MKSEKPKTALICFIHRKKFAEVHLNTPIFFEQAYEFCPTCEGWMLRNFERDMLGLTLLPLDKSPVKVVLKKVRF